MVFVFLFKQKTAYEMRISDWSSDVCSSGLPPSAPSRYKPDRTGASCHASTHPKDDDDGTALRHGLAADRGVRAADRLSCGHGVRALGLPREDRAPADLGGNPDVPDEPVATDVAVRRVGRSEEHTSELQSLMRISYAVFCLKKKNYHES